jgi:membrane protein involved in colicin uptake
MERKDLTQEEKAAQEAAKAQAIAEAKAKAELEAKKKAEAEAKAKAELDKKEKSVNQQTEKADAVFEEYPQAQELHCTSDGFCFFLSSDASNHANTLEDKTVKTIKRK